MAKSSKQGKMFAILARCQRAGRWLLAPRFSVLAFLGSCRLDLRAAHVDGEKSKVKVTVFLGSASIMLPQGAEVRPSGLAFLSASSVDVPDAPDSADLPLIEIEWTAILGRFRIGTEETLDDHDDEVVEVASAPSRPLAAAAETQAAPADPPPGIGFEDLEPEPATPPAGIGFEDLEPEPATPPAGIGFEDLGTEPEPETRHTPRRRRVRRPRHRTRPGTRTHHTAGRRRVRGSRHGTRTRARHTPRRRGLRGSRHGTRTRARHTPRRRGLRRPRHRAGERR